MSLKFKKRAQRKKSLIPAKSKEQRTVALGRKAVKQVVPSRFFGKVLNESSHEAGGQIDVRQVVLRVVMLAQALSGKKYYPYQIEFGSRVVEAFLERKSDVVTALISRQSGKTEVLSSVVAALSLIFPVLARKYQSSWHLNLTSEQGVYQGFRDGVKIGIYAPRRHQAETMFNRCKLCFETDAGKKILRELKLNVSENNGTTLRLTNGSRILCESASEQSKIEGETHQLLIAEEAQDINDKKMNKSLSPMLSSTKGTMVMIGTATAKPCAFYYTIKYNERLFYNDGPKNHFFYPHTICESYNSLYRDYVAAEKLKLGEDSDEFRMSYGCEWIFERGMFLTEQQLFHPQVALLGGPFSSIFRFGLHGQQQYSIVAGLDFGKSHDSTVMTLVAVDWMNPVRTVLGNDVVTLYEKHVLSWFEWVGDDYETQFWELTSILKKVGSLKKVVLDSNTAGEPIKDRMTEFFSATDVTVEGFNFAAKKKSDAYKSLFSDFSGKRVTFPASQSARETQQFRKFTSQMLDLRKEYAGGLMKVHHPDEKGAKDDYCDSLMMAVWGANTPSIAGQTESSSFNPFIS